MDASDLSRRIDRLDSIFGDFRHERSGQRATWRKAERQGGLVNYLWDNLFRKSKKNDEIRAALRENNLFKDLSERELRFLEDIVHVRHFHAGEPVFRQGEVGVGMYIIVKGRVEIFVTDDTNSLDDSRDIFITQLVSGYFFGELSLVEEIG